MEVSREALQSSYAATNTVADAEASDIQQGYKRTEAGLIPVEWEASELGVLCSFENGDRSAKYPSPRSFVSEGVPFINAGHLASRRIDLRGMDYITQAAFNQLGGGKVHAGDILFCLRGTLGKFGVVEPGFGQGAIASSLVIVRTRSRNLISEFLAFYFESDLCSRMIEKWAGGAAQPNLGAQDLARFAIPVPPTGEQRAITKALSDMDALLGALEALIAKKHTVKQAAMQQLLTAKTRLPGFSREWEVQPLSELAAIEMGQSPDSKNYNRTGDGLPLVQGNADIEAHHSISRVWTTQVTKEGRAGDLLLTVRAPVGAVARISERCCLGRGVCSLTPYGDADFLFHALVFAEPAWQALEQGSTFTSANSTQVAAFAISSPTDPDEQAAVAAVLSAMDAEIAALEARREKTLAVKEGMMQELLTGRVRLVKPESEAST